MASLSNINGIFDVHSTGAILFSTSHGTSGQILKSNGNAAPTWVDASTVIGGPYLPLTGGTLTGATATASGISFTVGGALTIGGVTALNASTTIIRDSTGYALRLDSADATTDNDLRFAKGGVDYAAIQVAGPASSEFGFYVHNGTNWINTLNFARADGQAVFTKLVSGITPTAAANFATKAYVDAHPGSGGTVTSVGGTGSVSGITLTGTVTTTGDLTLGGTLSASITNISDAARWWNNFGDNHGTRTSFDASTASYGFGWRYVQGNTNGPGTGGTQFYSAYVGLGNQYPSTGTGSYGAYLAFDRNVTNPYLSIRYNEANVLSTWRKISAGTADVLTTARTIAGVSFDGSADISLNNNAITNGAGYTTNTGTVTSLTLGNGLTGSSLTGPTPNILMSGSYTGKFTVDSTGDVEYLALNTTATTNKRVRIQFTQNDNAGIEIGTDYSVDNSSNIYFYNRAAAGSAWLFSSQANNWFQGKLGIGMTSNPSQTLHVKGSNHFVTFENTSTTANHYSQMLLKAGTALGYIWTANQNSTNWGGPNSLNIYTGQAGAIAFFTTAVKRMTIQAAGNVFIETKLGIANSNPAAKLSIGPTVSSGATGISVNVGVGEGNLIGIGNNHHNWFPFTNGQNYYSSDIHNFRNAAHSTTYMTLDSVGLGIGTASPSTKLHVSHTTRIDDAYGLALVENTSTGTGSAANSALNIKSKYGTSQFMQWENQGLRIGSRIIANGAPGDVYFTAGSDSVKMVMKANGNLGIGTTGPGAKLEVVYGGGYNTGIKVRSTSGYSVVTMEANAGSYPILEFKEAGTQKWQFFNSPTDDSMNFYSFVTAGTKMTMLHGGNIGIGITSPTAKLHVEGSASIPAARLYGTGGTVPPLELRQNNTAGWFAKFYSDNFGTYVGGISFYGSSTTFNTSSDYRLKENIIPISDSISRLKKLKPSRFNFKQYPEITIDGFLAHEVQDIVPEAVTGDKDELDLSGKPVYQAIDHSRLVPLLVAAIKELEARVKELENK